MLPWLARLSFSFLIIAGLLFWYGYRGFTGRDALSKGQIALYFLSGFVLTILGFIGVKHRHRPRDPNDEYPRTKDQ
jgi:hypothetical protein